MVEAVADLVLVHVSNHLAECERRDPMRLYARARRGEILEFTGISSPYEVPGDADVMVDTSVLDRRAVVMASTDGQDVGSRRWPRRPRWTSRPGVVKTFRRTVAAVAVSTSGPVSRPTARARLWARTVRANHTALAMNVPDGRCASLALLSTAMLVLHDGVAAVVGLDLQHIALAVGDERVVVPGVDNASWLPGVVRTRHTTRRT